LQARSVQLTIEQKIGEMKKMVNLPAPTQGFNWEIAEIWDDAAPLLSSIPLPRLRRLRLTYDKAWTQLDLNPLLDILSNFTSLTWFDCQAFVERGDPVFINEDRPPIVLPNLQVLWYKNRKAFEFPFSHLILPSLHYLTIHIHECTSRVPLLNLLSCYRKTFRSFVAARFKHRGDISFIDFPSWRDFPQLEELVLDEQWVVHFQSLPPNHLLQKLEAHLGTFDPVPSLLEGVNMQKIILKWTYWTGEGGLVDGNGGSMDGAGVDRLLERAKDRGIEISVTFDGEKLPNRGEDIAAAAGATSG
jgi:hypothetical protein